MAHSITRPFRRALAVLAIAAPALAVSGPAIADGIGGNYWYEHTHDSGRGDVIIIIPGDGLTGHRDRRAGVCRSLGRFAGDLDHAMRDAQDDADYARSLDRQLRHDGAADGYQEAWNQVNSLTGLFCHGGPVRGICRDIDQQLRDLGNLAREEDRASGDPYAAGRATALGRARDRMDRIHSLHCR